jgi:hypothetical protein
MNNTIKHAKKSVIFNLNAFLALQSELRNSNHNGFISILGYENKYGEVSNHVIQLRCSYANAVAHDIENLPTLELEGIADQARNELVESLRNPRSYNIERMYFTPNLFTETTKKGEKTTYISGNSISKKVLVEGQYPSVNSSQKTIEKNKLRKQMKSNKIKRFDVRNAHTVKVNGKVFNLLREE